MVNLHLPGRNGGQEKSWMTMSGDHFNFWWHQIVKNQPDSPIINSRSCKNVMQLWMEINVVTLQECVPYHKVLECMTLLWNCPMVLKVLERFPQHQPVRRHHPIECWRENLHLSGGQTTDQLPRGQQLYRHQLPLSQGSLAVTLNHDLGTDSETMKNQTFT